MTVANSIQAQLDEAEFVVRQQMARIAELEGEVERLKAGLDAHGTLQAIYRNPASPEGNRIKAATAALPVEKGKVLSVPPPLLGDRRERWRVYETWQLRKQLILETRSTTLPHGWDAHLQADVYTPPEGDLLPPVEVIDTGSGFKVLSNLLPKSGQHRIIGNGNGGDGSDQS